MCIIIVKPAGVEVPEANLRFCNDRNRDGIGMCWSQDGKLKMWKNVDSKSIDDAVALAKEIVPFDALLHFRIATHGAITVDNVHPFFADEEQTIAVAHNGVLGIREADFPDMILYFKDGWMNNPTTVREIMKAAPLYPLDRQSGDSDTRIFVKNIIGQLDPKTEWWKIEEVRAEIEHLLNNDRMAMLTPDGLTIFNEKMFAKKDGIAYSHHNFEPSWSAPKNDYGATSTLGARRASTGDTDEDVDDYWRRHTTQSPTRYAPKTKDVAETPRSQVRVTPMQVDPFKPLDENDFIVAYYRYPVDKDTEHVTCVRCDKNRPSEDDGCGLFASDMQNMFICSTSCELCGKPLTEIAEAILEEIAIVEEVADHNDVVADSAPCIVCGETPEHCHCTVKEIARGRKELGIVGVLHATTEKASVTFMVNMLATQGSDDETVAKFAIKLRELGENPDEISLQEAAEKYPDLIDA